MAKGLSPLDTVLTIIKTMSPKEIQCVRDQLGIHERVVYREPQSPCDKTGHKFKSVGKTMRLFLPPSEKLFCEKCGKTKVI